MNVHCASLHQGKSDYDKAAWSPSDTGGRPRAGTQETWIQLLALLQIV